MIGDFTEHARAVRDDIVALQADLELDRFQGSVEDVTADIHDAVSRLAEDAVSMVEVAIEEDDRVAELESNEEVVTTFVTRITGILRELEWSDPDGDVAISIRDALRRFDDGEDEFRGVPVSYLGVA